MPSFALWICALFGGIGVVLTVSWYVAARIMRPKDELPKASGSTPFRRADLIEQEQRLEAMGIKISGDSQASHREN
jgi:hypothetical protein